MERDDVRAMELRRLRRRLKPIGLHNLLTGEPAPWEAELRRGAEEARRAGRDPDAEYISYWKPKMRSCSSTRSRTR